MEILNQVTLKKEGNECFITYYIYIVRLDYHKYITFITEAVSGSWTGNPITTNFETFTDYPDALEYIDKLVEKAGA